MSDKFFHWKAFQNAESKLHWKSTCGRVSGTAQLVRQRSDWDKFEENRNNLVGRMFCVIFLRGGGNGQLANAAGLYLVLRDCPVWSRSCSISLTGLARTLNNAVCFCPFLVHTLNQTMAGSCQLSLIWILPFVAIKDAATVRSGNRMYSAGQPKLSAYFVFG